MDNGNGTGMVMPVAPAYGGMFGNSGWGNNFGGDGWWILLLLFAAMGNGFGGWGGFGGMGGFAADGSYARRGRDGDGDGRYNEGRSRDYSRENYSRDMKEKLRRMMDETSSERERDTIMRCISKLEN